MSRRPGTILQSRFSPLPLKQKVKYFHRSLNKLLFATVRKLYLKARASSAHDDRHPYVSSSKTRLYTDALIAQVHAIRDVTKIRHTAKMKSKKKKVLENLQCYKTSRAAQGKLTQNPATCSTTARPQSSETEPSSAASLCVSSEADLCSASASGAADASGPSQAVGLRDRADKQIQRASLQPGGHVGDILGSV